MNFWARSWLAIVALSSGCELPPNAWAEPPPPQADASKPAPPKCPPAPTIAGYESCEAAEITGNAPCEAICTRPQKLAAADPCCTDPIEVAVIGGTRVLLRVEACSFVPPQCTHVHGHGRMDANVRVLSGPTPEVLVVEGGCEMRATSHWSWCNDVA